MPNRNADRWTLGARDFPRGGLLGFLDDPASLADNPLYRAIIWNGGEKIRGNAGQAALFAVSIAGFFAVHILSAAPQPRMRDLLLSGLMLLPLLLLLPKRNSAIQESMGVPRRLLLELGDAAYPARELALGYWGASVKLWGGVRGALPAILSAAALSASVLALWTKIPPYLTGIVVMIAFVSAYVASKYLLFADELVLRDISYELDRSRPSIVPENRNRSWTGDRTGKRLLASQVLIMLSSTLRSVFVAEHLVPLMAVGFGAGILWAIWMARRAREMAPKYFAKMEEDLRHILYWLCRREHDEATILAGAKNDPGPGDPARVRRA